VISLVALFGGIYAILEKGTQISYRVNGNNIKNGAVVGEITSNVVVEQELEGIENFQGVRMLLATYANPNVDAIYTLQIVTAEGKVLCENVVKSDRIEDNAYYYLTLEEKLDLTGERLRIVISSENGTHGNAITVWKSSADLYTEGQLLVNGKITEGDIVFDYVTDVNEDLNMGVLGYRIASVLLLFTFICLNIWCPLRKLYDFIFKYRLAIVVVLFVLLVANGIHYSSVGMYDTYVQTGMGSGYNEPIWGQAQGIRSDEWLVSLPRRLAVAFAGAGDTNYIPMAMEMGNLTSTGIELGWGALAKPYEWGYLTGNSEFGISFYWNFLLLFTVFFSFEMCLILTKGKKLLSAAGALLIGYSSFFLWWFVAIWLMTGQGAIVCLNYAIKTENKWKKIFFGIWTAIFASNFVVVLYPAWQVPAGYLFLILLVMIIISNWDKIKAFRKIDWAIIIGCVLFMVSIMGAYFLSYTEYMTAISETVYPGERVCVGGDALGKLSNYIGSWKFAFESVANPSEQGIMLNLFPLPMLLGAFYMIKTKKWDGMIGGLIALSLFLTAYCSTGLPLWLAKITLMTSSTEKRAVDILALVQLYLLILVAGRVKEEQKCKRWVMFIATFVCVLVAAYKFDLAMPVYFNKYELLTITVVITLLILPWISKASAKERLISGVVICTASLVTGFLVNPVMKGLDVIYTKPAAQAIMSIVEEEPHAKWITTDSITTSGFTIACGAPTINSTNFIPNYGLWEILDEDNEYEEYWNRYAHMVIHLTEEEETGVVLNQVDMITVSLSYDDLEKIDISYIYALTPLPSTENVELEEVYNEAGNYIYKVNYK
jgi:hypothetical protein